MSPQGTSAFFHHTSGKDSANTVETVVTETKHLVKVANLKNKNNIICSLCSSDILDTNKTVNLYGTQIYLDIPVSYQHLSKG